MGSNPSALYNCFIRDLIEIDKDAVYRCIDSSEPHPALAGTYREALVISAYNSLLKKLEPDDSSTQDEVAINKFFECNKKCASWTVDGISDNGALLVLDEARNIVSHLADLFCDKDWLHDGDLGAGSNIKASGVSMYQKLFAGPLTGTNAGLIRYYKYLLSSNPRWAANERRRSHQFGKPEIVSGSSLSTVPKNVRESRVICTEATLNMWFQQSIDKTLRRWLKSEFHLDLDHQQSVNRAIIQENLDGSMCTLDLSSASDTIAISFCEWFFGKCDKRFVAILRTFRSTHAIFSDDPLEEEYELNMIASMGNGFCFSLQTVIFTSIVIASYKLLGIKPRFTRTKRQNDVVGCIDKLPPMRLITELANFGVNGDDIIVHRKAYDIVSRCLEACGFSVNKEKSFATGPFRETCGLDTFECTNVRGVYLKRLSTPQDIYKAINRLNEWCSYHNVTLRRTITYLYHSLKGSDRLLVPRSEGYVGGICVPSSFIPKRFAKLATRIYEPGYTPHYEYVYRSYAPCAPFVKLVSKKKWICGIYNDSRSKLLCTLRLKMRDQIVCLRQYDTRFAVDWRSTHSWDMNVRGSDGKFLSEWEQRRWSDAVEENLRFLLCSTTKR